jgi:hypothetical protein
MVELVVRFRWKLMELEASGHESDVNDRRLLSNFAQRLPAWSQAGVGNLGGTHDQRCSRFCFGCRNDFHAKELAVDLYSDRAAKQID